MGLDDFASDNSSTTSSTDDESNESTDESNEHGGSTGAGVDPLDETDVNFFGSENPEPGTRPMERKGAMSNHSTSELLQNADGELQVNSDHIKYHMPFFATITSEEQHRQGDRYQIVYTEDDPAPSWNRKVVSCVGTVETRLGNINKEVAMFLAGSPSKKRVMQTLDEKLGDDLSADTNVFLNFFGDVFYLRDMAQANEEYREGDLVNRDKVGSKVIKPKQLRIMMQDSEESEE